MWSIFALATIATQSRGVGALDRHPPKSLLRGSSQAGRTLQISCTYSDSPFAQPIDVSEQCCDDITSWLSATDASSAEPHITGICSDSGNCSSEAQSIYQATSPFVPTLVDPECATVVQTVFVLSGDGTCGQAEVSPTDIEEPMEIGTCGEQGYGTPTTDTFELGGIIYDEYLETQTKFLIHSLDIIPNLCSQKRVLAEEVDTYIETLNYKLASCARENFLEFIFTSPDGHDVFNLPPQEPRKQTFDFTVRDWMFDYMRPTAEPRQSSASLPQTQRMKGVLVNGVYPAPLIDVYENDIIHVKVDNKLLAEGTTIHWHGLHQRNTPWADGADLITQAPIRPMESFQYSFKADPPGTFFYHSHTGVQRARGLEGPLIIQKRDDPFRAMYDEDRIVFISDQMREPDGRCEGDEQTLLQYNTG